MSDESHIAALVDAHQSAKRAAATTRAASNALRARLAKEEEEIEKAQRALLEALDIDLDDY